MTEPDAEAGTLQAVVERIGSLIDEVEAHQSDATLVQAQAQVQVRAREPTRHSGTSDAQVPAATIDSTQTVRALTLHELEDSGASQWFAIELAQSGESIDSAEIPDIDIFVEYQLYSVKASLEERNLHLLRVGFFSSQIAAEAVAGYLGSYFSAPKVLRVSIAERERFAERLVTAQKDVGESGKGAAIEVICPPSLPETRMHAEPAGAVTASGPRIHSFWSRLIGM
jgi:hypothetical protein